MPGAPDEAADLAPSAHGGDGARLARALGISPAAILDLSASINPVAPDPLPVLRRHLDAVSRYPDAGPATAALASAMGVDQQRLLLTNGGAEAIALVASHLGRGWVDEPDFSLYRRHLPRLDPHGPRFRSNPHNPSGRLAPATDSAAVWDEAFYPLATGRWTRGDPGAVVVGSLTKLLACPGLRVGYVLTPDAGAAAAVARQQPRWSVNGLVCDALEEMLAGADLPRWASATVALRADMTALLRRYGLEPLPSDANWLLVPDAAHLRAPLARRGVLVRDCTSFGLPGHIRVAVPPAAGLERLEAALASAMG